jgi:intein-encoded DNA endonuclease-like protein
MKKELTDNEKSEIIRLYNKEKLTLGKIKSILNIDERRISKFLKNNGFTIECRMPPTKRQLEIKDITNKNKELILRMYLEEERTVAEIGRYFDLDQAAIWRFLKKNNIKIRPVQWNQYDIDENYFENIDSHEKAYWLGWLFSDGFMIENNNRIGIRLHPKDIEILEKFKTCLKADVPIHVYHSKRKPNLKRGFKGGDQSISQFIFCNRKICQDLKQYGMKDKKSLTLEFPKIDHKYLYSFLRGYIDGDGCICISKDKKHNQYKFTVAIISAKKFINELYILLQKEGFQFGVNRANRCKNTYVLTLSRKNEVVKFLDKIYEQDGNYFRLTRKYNKYTQMKNFLIENPVNVTRITSKPLPNRYL